MKRRSEKRFAIMRRTPNMCRMHKAYDGRLFNSYKTNALALYELFLRLPSGGFCKIYVQVRRTTVCFK